MGSCSVPLPTLLNFKRSLYERLNGVAPSNLSLRIKSIGCLGSVSEVGNTQMPWSNWEDGCWKFEIIVRRMN